MPQTTAELLEVLDLEEIELDLYRGRSSTDTQWQRAFGGQVLAQALMAAYRTVDGRTAHSLNAYFLRPGRTDIPIIYDVERTRDGGSFSSRRISARQGGHSIFTMSCSFHDLESGLEHSDPVPPDVPDPDDCPRLADVLAKRFDEHVDIWREWAAVDTRLAGDSRADGGICPDSHRAHMRVWMRTDGPLPDDFRLHQAGLAYASDVTLLSVATLPHRLTFLSPQIQAASIDHAMWFHRPVRADSWLLYDQISPSASHSLGLSIGRVFQDGHLVASCAQEGLIRVVK